MPKVIIMLGSENDDKYVVESKACELLDICDIEWEIWVISAHRNHHEATEKSKEIVKNGLADLVIAAAGKMADLPKVVAAATDFRLLVIGVPLPSSAHPDAGDAIAAMTDLPKGCPILVASGVGADSLFHAAHLATLILSTDSDIISKMMRASLVKYYSEKIQKPAIIPLRKSEKKKEKEEHNGV